MNRTTLALFMEVWDRVVTPAVEDMFSTPILLGRLTD